MNTPKHNAMAFHNPEGFEVAYKHAMAFAGDGGHVATLPDVIRARLTSAPGDAAWEAYFTTMTAEYVGLSRGGNPIAIVAHGLGPMSTLDGILASYSHEFADRNRSRRGGRIFQEQFLRLEDGAFGEVRVIDLESTWKRREYAFGNHAITAQEIINEPLWQARLGAQWAAYIDRHTAIAREWDKERRENEGMTKLDSDVDGLPCILAMDSANNCNYSERSFLDRWLKDTPGTAIAHLLSIGQLMTSHHQYWRGSYDNWQYRTSLASDVDCHEWWNGVRLLGVQAGATELCIHPGLPNYSALVRDHLASLWTPNPRGVAATSKGFWHLVEMAGHWFTDYPKDGERMDNGEPEFLVTKKVKIEGPTLFRTDIGGYHGFFKYGINEVQRIAPKGANAYSLGDASISGNQHVAPIMFYHIEVDTTRRLLRMADIYRDYDLMRVFLD